MTPQVVDWNNDGINDLIVGDSSGYINYFRGTAPQTLTEEPKIQASGVNIDVGNYSSPVVIDWNEDGLDDLVIGAASPGDIRLYLNSGTPSTPLFTTYSSLQSGGSTIIHTGACAEVYDLNCDGKKDLIVSLSQSGNGRIYFYENVGTHSAPEFNGYVHLESGGSPISLYQYTRVEVVDWNEDGFPDMLASEYYGYVYLFIAIPVSIGDVCEPITPGTVFMVAGSPTSGLFSVTLELSGTAQTEIDIFSMSGERLERVIDGTMGAGTHVLSADIGSAPAGMYFVRCVAGQEVFTEKVVLVR